VPSHLHAHSNTDIHTQPNGDANQHAYAATNLDLHAYSDGDLHTSPTDGDTHARTSDIDAHSNQHPDRDADTDDHAGANKHASAAAGGRGSAAIRPAGDSERPTAAQPAATGAPATAAAVE
jgi:hypothetical protein